MRWHRQAIAININPTSTNSHGYGGKVASRYSKITPQEKARMLASPTPSLLTRLETGFSDNPCPPIFDSAGSLWAPVITQSQETGRTSYAEEVHETVFAHP
jgi:hypothetical protein